MKHLMVDIETLDTRPSAIILSVAILMFDPSKEDYVTRGSWTLDPAEQLAQGRTVSLDTVKWWIAQGYNARKKAFASEAVCDLEATKSEILAIIRDSSIENIWANDPDFDCCILRDFIGYEAEWPFWKHRSLRTIRELFPDAYDAHNLPRTLVAHDPVDDCIKQICNVGNVYQHIQKSKAWNE